MPLTGQPGAPMLLPRHRVGSHVQALGITWMLYGGYRLLTGMVAAAALHALAAGDFFHDVPPMASELARSLGPLIGVFLVVGSVLAMVTGYGLIARKPWARVLAIALGIFTLLRFPFGTALGVYTLWVLAPRASADEWQTLTANPATPLL